MLNQLYIAIRLAFSFRWSVILQKVSKYRREERSDTRESHKSPFEGVTQQEMMDVVRNIFPNVRIAMTCAFTTEVAQFIHVETNWPITLKRIVIWATMALDNILVRSGILRGEFVFMYARKLEEN